MSDVTATRRTRVPQWEWLRVPLSQPGVAVGLVFAAVSFTPSLLPRPAAFQGAVAGIDAVMGYGVGVLGAWVWREFADREPRRPSARAWQVTAGVGALALVVAMALGRHWHVRSSRLIGAETETAWAGLLIPVVAVLVFLLLLALARLARAAYRRTSGWLEQRMGARAARATGLVLLVASAALVLSGVVWAAAMDVADRTYALRDVGTPEGAVEPTTELRSGGPGSLVPWDTLGREGRAFTGGGPDAEDISAFHDGAPALEPVRIYAGIASAETAEERAELAVRDLERAGGFDREHLLVVTTTGTGWVEPSAVGSFEYLTDGDSAVVSMQYSHLPSWLSFLVDQDKAREAGRQLYDAVYGRWIALPQDERPELHVFGESLGSFGGETAFSGEYDLRNRVDGALFVGSPNFNPLYREFIEGRDPGSPEVEPVFRDGRTIRFSTSPRTSLPPDDAAWTGTRVLYLQHPSDPVTWWSPDLLLTRPDWLEEPRGQDVLEEMRWMPGVTFWQVTADLALGFSTPPGHGHNFSGEHVDGWVAVLDRQDIEPARLEELRDLFRRDQ